MGPSHPVQHYFVAMGIEHKTTRSADDPEASGACKAWMKHLKKIWHASYAEGADPVLELKQHLRQVRATLHPTTGVSPAELTETTATNSPTCGMTRPRTEKTSVVPGSRMSWKRPR